MKILIVLGSPNDEEGALSEMAVSRVEKCFALYRDEPYKIVLTGGFGAHFNTTNQAHAIYLKDALLQLGVFESDIVATINAANSVEDASLSKWIIATYNPQSITIVTSDYHAARAKLIFETIYAPFTEITMEKASSEKVDPNILAPLVAHEKKALQALVENGIYY